MIWQKVWEDLSDIHMEVNTAYLVVTAFGIAKKTIIVNWKTKNKLCTDQLREALLDHIGLEKMIGGFQAHWGLGTLSVPWRFSSG